MDPAAIVERFQRQFGQPPRLFRAPGRVNLIGEHTDYSGGFAMPAAIDRACIVAIAKNNTGLLRIISITLDDRVERPAASFQRKDHWSDYVAAPIAALQAEGHTVAGMDILLESSVPLGAGVSSSAAVGVATSLALMTLEGAAPEKAALHRIAWAAEKTFVGAPCGPMDQYASINGRAGQALMLDCRSLTATPVPIPPDTTILVIDSGIKHAVRDGGYIARRQDCEAAAAALGVTLLRDANLGMIEGGLLDERQRQRARHVVTENQRVLDAANALRKGDATALGHLMQASHASLRDDFDATCPETDELAAIANATKGVFGARQMGGGFGGCVVALTQTSQTEDAAAAIAFRYQEATGKPGKWFTCQLADGAGEITP